MGGDGKGRAKGKGRDKKGREGRGRDPTPLCPQSIFLDTPLRVLHVLMYYLFTNTELYDEAGMGARQLTSLP